MGKKDTDKKLNRFSTIIELITNLGTIGSWILGAGSAYVLNVQKFPVVVPGVDFTLDINFQFSLVLCSMLAYIHFMQNFWRKNRERLGLSDSFSDFCFWELPRLKHPLFLIPIVLIVAVWGQIVVDSGWLLVSSLLFLGIAIYFLIKAFSYHLSPNREYEILLQQWDSDSDWKEKWFKRITARLNNFGKVKVSDLFEVGIGFKDKAKLEIAFAFGKYFDVYEFDKNLILIKTSQLPIGHPDREPLSTRSEWIIMFRENLDQHLNS